MLKQIKILPVREHVASELRNAIFSGSLKPGQELGQDSTAKKLGVSRMPVREAFQILAAEGLLDLRVNHRAVVKDVSRSFIREHFEIRLLLEAEAVARACSLITDYSELEFIHGEQRKAIDALDFKETSLCNQAFHMYIWEHAGNSKLNNILVQLWNGLSIGTVIQPADHANLSYTEHSRIIQALKDRDPVKAREIMIYHVQRSMANMLMRPGNHTHPSQAGPSAE